jgi:hypothetical protein
VRRAALVTLSACGFSGAPAQGDGGPDAAPEMVCDGAACNVPLPASCAVIKASLAMASDGVYNIDPDGDGPQPPFATFCDMTVDEGGWTLVGKVDGRHMMADRWLVQPVDVPALSSPQIGNDQFACANAVHLAVHAATEIRFTNSSRAEWVKWSLPEGRTKETWWRHAAGAAAIGAADAKPVVVRTNNGSVVDCFQNIYGILPQSSLGGSYPSTAYNEAGNVLARDGCMSIGTVLPQTSANGFSQNGNGFDAPEMENVWPNMDVAVPPHVAIWLR